MLKKAFALVAGVSLLTGCIAANEFQNLSKTLSKGTLLVRSLTATNPQDGTVKVTNFLGWISLSGTAPSQLDRNGAQIADASKLTTSSYQDTDAALQPGNTYLYSLTLGSTAATQSVLTRTIPDTSFGNLQPTKLLPADHYQAGAKPELSWTKSGETPKGYIVSVTQISNDPNAAPAGGNNLSGTPYYVAFLDAASHSVGVAYGTESDLAAITKDELLSKTLSEMPGGFFKQENKELTTGRYIWTIVAIDHDDKKTAFAVPAPSAMGTFGVQ